MARLVASADRRRGQHRPAMLDSRDLSELNDGQVSASRMMGDDEFQPYAGLASGPEKGSEAIFGAPSLDFPGLSRAAALGRPARFPLRAIHLRPFNSPAAVCPTPARVSNQPRARRKGLNRRCARMHADGRT